MKVIGLTGGISCGKSVCSRYFEENHKNEIYLVDADKIAREVVEPGTKTYKSIVNEFGKEILFDDGTLNRVKLGKMIFGDEDKRKKLNKLIHPAIMKEMVWRIVKAYLLCYPLVILDAPLLFETKINTWVHSVIVVHCQDDIQMERLMKRDQISEQEANQKIGSQMLQSQKCAFANHLIDNSGTVEETRMQLRTLSKKIIPSKLATYFWFLAPFAMFFFVSWMGYKLAS